MKPERLKDIGIEVRQNLPGVGENLQDHLNVRMTYECTQPIAINDMLNSKTRGFRAMNAVSDEEDRLPCHVDRDGSHHSESRGGVHASTPNPEDYPTLEANYFDHPADVDVTLTGLKKAQEIAAHPAMQHLVVCETRPGADIVDDGDLIAYMKETSQTRWHQVGICRMGRDEQAVVGPDLKVHGVAGLRAADASVMPHLTASNTNAPSIMIGERCADLICNEWR